MYTDVKKEKNITLLRYETPADTVHRRYDCYYNTGIMTYYYTTESMSVYQHAEVRKIKKRLCLHTEYSYV